MYHQHPILYDNEASAAVGHQPYLIEEVDAYDVVHHAVMVNREGMYILSIFVYVCIYQCMIFF